MSNGTPVAKRTRHSTLMCLDTSAVDYFIQVRNLKKTVKHLVMEGKVIFYTFFGHINYVYEICIALVSFKMGAIIGTGVIMERGQFTITS